MTKTKKILTIAVASVLVAAAIFFAVFPSIYGKVDYAKYAKENVRLNAADLIGLIVSADDSDLAAPTDDDMWKKIAETLYKYREEAEDSTDTAQKYVEYKDAPIGRFDALFGNYLGYYKNKKDENGQNIYFTSGEKMAKSTLQTFLVGAGAYNNGEGKWFADAMIGLKPSDYKYTVVDMAEGASTFQVPGSGEVVVYLDYSWIRYTFTGEGADKVRTEAGKSGDEAYKNLPKENLRVDLSKVPASLPSDFASYIYGAEYGGSATPIKFTSTISITETVEGQAEPVTTVYEYDYTVNIKFVVKDWVPFTFEYTYPADSDAKDIYGNELKGETVIFEAVIEYFHNVPELTDEFDVPDSEGKKESIVTHDDYLNLDAKTDYYPKDPGENDRKLLSETEWNALTDKGGNATYGAYLAMEYEGYTEHTLKESYNDSRMYVAADEIWKAILEKATVTYPKRLLKLAYNERLDYYEYNYNEGTSTVNGATVMNRSYYKSLGAYIEAAFAKEMKEMNVTGWKAFIEAEAKEAIAHTLIVYYLYDALDLTYDEDAYADVEYMVLLYQVYYGVSGFTESQIKEAVMFDCVMEHLYGEANVDWKSEQASAGE